MKEEEAREAYFELKIIEEQMKQLQRQLAQIEAGIAEFENAIKSVEELKGKSGEEAFVPVSAGIYAKSTIGDTESFVVNVGANVAVEKSGEETMKIIEKQVEEMKKYREQMMKGMQLLSARAEEIERMVCQN